LKKSSANSNLGVLKSDRRRARLILPKMNKTVSSARLRRPEMPRPNPKPRWMLYGASSRPRYVRID